MSVSRSEPQVDVSLTGLPGVGPAVAGHLAGVVDLLGQIEDAAVASAFDAVARASLEGRAVFVFGNGGSASTAEHFATDLSKTSGARPMCLVSNMAQLTATANDDGYDAIFEHELRTWMRPDDLVIGFSVSGTSPNCVSAIRYAKRHGGETIAFVGRSTPDGMLAFADHPVVVPSSDHRSVESIHLVLAHAIAAGLSDGGHDR